MMETKTLEEQLQEMAHAQTDNFCYLCYVVVEGDFCPHCHTDDFMRHLAGVGVEYGYQWVIDSILAEHLEPFEEDEESYNDMLDECYPDVEIGCCTWSASDALKELDPIAYDCGMTEYFDSLKEDMELYTDGNGREYRAEDVQELIEELS